MLGKDPLRPVVQKVQLGIRLKSLGIPIRIVVGKDKNGRGATGEMTPTDHLPEPNADRHLTSTKVRRARKVVTPRADANAAAMEVLVQHFIFSLT